MFLMPDSWPRAACARCSKTDRLDWMYQGGVMARQEADQRLDAAAAAAGAAQDQQQQQQAEQPSGVRIEQLGCAWGCLAPRAWVASSPRGLPALWVAS
jgi:hypothetical protein